MKKITYKYPDGTVSEVRPTSTANGLPIPTDSDALLKRYGYEVIIEELPDPEPTEEQKKQQQIILLNMQIAEYEAKLNESDYKAIKYAEGWITAEEYADTKTQRQAWRDEINKLQEELAEFTKVEEVVEETVEPEATEAE